MRRGFFGTAMAALFLLAGSAPAQTAEKMPKPGPEQKRIGYFAGTWRAEGEMEASPFGPAGKFSSTDECEWFAGGLHLVCHSSGKGPLGATRGLGIIGYNGEEKVYTYYGIDNMGFGSLSRGTLEGTTWTWTSEDKMKGKTIKSRYTVFESSPTLYAFMWEISEDGKSWTTVAEGKETKASEKEAKPAEGAKK